jgi:hypothetical protein
MEKNLSRVGLIWYDMINFMGPKITPMIYKNIVWLE